MIVNCKKCFAGNAFSATSCHNCGTRLHVRPASTTLGGMVTMRDEHVHDGHILDTALAAQRSREARVARRMLALAAICYFLRVTLMPVLGGVMPPERFASLSGPHVTPVHYVCLVMFVACYAWSRREPLNATLTAGVLFLFAVVPGFIANPTVSGGALIGKLMMLCIVGRAVSAAIMYRANCGRPELAGALQSKPTPTRRMAA
jgi:hypothetical protein